MSFLNPFKKRSNIPPNATFTLTQVGRKRVQEFSGDPKSRILTSLETRGTSDVEEISQASGISKGAVERFLPQLIRGGYIQYVRGNGEEEV